MSPPPSSRHLVRQQRISGLLNQLLPAGGSFTEGAVSTLQGTKVADVVWYPAARAREVADNDLSLPDFSPDICVEVQSPREKMSEMEKKAAAYFGVGVREVWVCDRQGKMRFYGPQGGTGRPAIAAFRPLPRVPQRGPGRIPAMSHPKTREVYKITVPAFHGLEPFLDPEILAMSCSGGQIYALPIPRNWRTTALMELDGPFLRQERPGLRV